MYHPLDEHLPLIGTKSQKHPYAQRDIGAPPVKGAKSKVGISRNWEARSICDHYSGLGLRGYYDKKFQNPLTGTKINARPYWPNIANNPNKNNKWQALPIHPQPAATGERFSHIFVTFHNLKSNETQCLANKSQHHKYRHAEQTLKQKFSDQYICAPF